MSNLRTISLEDGTYEVHRDRHGVMIGRLRHGEPWPQGFATFGYANVFHAALNEIERLLAPIDMILHCPKCGTQHIDAADDSCGPIKCQNKPQCAEPCGEWCGWTNPPHRSHLCHGCGHIWRPADVPTNGVAEIKTKGKNDSPTLLLNLRSDR